MQKTDTGPPVLIQFPTAQVLASQRLPALEIVAYTGGFMTVPEAMKWNIKNSDRHGRIALKTYLTTR